MDHAPLSLLFSVLILLIIFSGFFSSSETAMMSLNRYRLRHLKKSKHRGATRSAKLLERPDRLIGLILIGNNLVNNFATAIATVVALRLYGDTGLLIAPIVLTLVVLIFAEVTPKTIAALHPERVAFPASFLLKPLLSLFYPAVVLINFISNSLVRIFGVDPEKVKDDQLSSDELRTVVGEAGALIPKRHQGMLLNILDLEKVTVNDIMIPRNEVVGIDLNDPVGDILEQLRTSAYTRLPVFLNDINNVIGILHLRNCIKFLRRGEDKVTIEAIRKHIREPYFVPESTPLNTQLLYFQKEKRRIALVVDEYGEVQGIITLEDLLEEIVGEFTTNLADNEIEIQHQEDGSYLIDGGTQIREINKSLDWSLPTNGPKTLNGLVLEYLESIPDYPVGFRIGEYFIETMDIKDNKIQSAKIRQKEIEP